MVFLAGKEMFPLPRPVLRTHVPGAPGPLTRPLQGPLREDQSPPEEGRLARHKWVQAGLSLPGARTRKSTWEQR